MILSVSPKQSKKVSLFFFFLNLVSQLKDLRMKKQPKSMKMLEIQSGQK